MRFTLSLLGGIVLAIIIALSTGGLLYAAQQPGSSAAGSSGENRPLAQATNTRTRTPTPTRTPTRTPTLRLTYFGPGAGNANVSVDTNGTEISIEASVDNLEPWVSPTNRGIKYAEFFVYDTANNLIDSHRENNSPYCYFQEDADGFCAYWDFAAHNFRWPGGAAVKNGQYFARVIGYTDNNKILMDEEPFYIDMQTDRFMGGIDIDVGDDTDGQAVEYVNALRFQGDVFTDDSSLPVTSVYLFVVAPDGTIPLVRKEENAPYCAFGDSGPNSDCLLWNFRANRDLWPNGVPIQRTFYSFRALAFSGDTLVAADTRSEPVRPSGQVQPPPPNNPPPDNPPPDNPPGGNPPTGNPPSNGNTSPNYRILADGANDVSQVTGALVFRTFAGDNGTDGDKIDHVEMSIYDSSGNRVHTRSEASAKYCAFGGNEACNPLTFAWEGYRWSNGSAMQNGGTYKLRAVIYFWDGRAPLTISRDVTIQF